MSIFAVLVIDNSDTVRVTLRQHFKRYACSFLEAADFESAGRLVSNNILRLVVVGEAEGGFDRALRFAAQLRASPSAPAVYLFPATSCEKQAVAALRARVDDYFCQPQYEELVLAARRHLTPPDHSAAGTCVVGDSPGIRAVRDYLCKIARSDCPVLIYGETGTGKELAARVIHQQSARRAKPFVALNCACIPDTLFESEMFGFERGAFTGAVGRRTGKLGEASGGTLFLDEVGELSPYAQAKLLRVLETKLVERLGGNGAEPVDLRVISATNRVLADAVRDGSFRRDLFFRLTVTQVHLPALRERVEDIPRLIEHFLCDINRRLGRSLEQFSPPALDLLLHHDWPGNVRELKNLIEAVAVETASGPIAVENLPLWFSSQTTTSDPRQLERASIVAALERTRWNKSKAAADLRWSRMTLYRKLALHRIGETDRPAQAAGVAAGKF